MNRGPPVPEDGWALLFPPWGVESPEKSPPEPSSPVEFMDVRIVVLPEFMDMDRDGRLRLEPPRVLAARDAAETMVVVILMCYIALDV